MGITVAFISESRGDDLMAKLIIQGSLPTMNEIIAASKRHHMQYSNMKGIYTDLVAMEATRQKLPVFDRVAVKITWYCKDRRQDPDNIASGEKFLLDGLVKAGKLENDGWKQINSLSHFFEVDKDNPRIEVELERVR